MMQVAVDVMADGVRTAYVAEVLRRIPVDRLHLQAGTGEVHIFAGHRFPVNRPIEVDRDRQFSEMVSCVCEGIVCCAIYCARPTMRSPTAPWQGLWRPMSAFNQQ